VYRTAGDPKYLLPETYHNAYRFGPPRELRLQHGALPYAWFYVALDVPTAIWEGRFARTDATRPGQFYLDPSAVKTGVVGQIAFGRDLRLWKLAGEACAKLGIQDTISSSDYEACHERFTATAAYAALIADPLYGPPPNRTVPMPAFPGASTG